MSGNMHERSSSLRLNAAMRYKCRYKCTFENLLRHTLICVTAEPTAERVALLYHPLVYLKQDVRYRNYSNSPKADTLILKNRLFGKQS